MNKRRFPSIFKKFTETLKRKLQSYQVYNNLKRSDIARKHETIEADTDITWVDPSKIRVMQLECDQTDKHFRDLHNRVPIHCPDKARFNPYHYSGVVLDGEWDKYVQAHEFDRVYRGLKEWHTNERPLEDTEYMYQYKLREQTYQKEGYFEQELDITKSLYYKIRDEGIKSRYELGTLEPDEPPYLQSPQWPVTVNIGRNGELIFNNTAHNRLALSKLFKFEKIPVLVVCRHKQYVEENNIPHS